MALNVGFAVLTHNRPDQLLRLLRTLNAMFDAPPVVCHHNFTQCPLRTEDFPRNVRFVTPHLDTRWGHVSLPMAAIAALRLLRETGNPDWYFLLSGSDYPVRPAGEIAEGLENARYDAFMDWREIRPGHMPPTQTAAHGFSRPQFIDIAVERYYFRRFWIPLPSRQLLAARQFPLWKRYFILRDARVNQVADRFQKPFRIFAGDFWFHANRKAIDGLLDAPIHKLARFYRGRDIPEESLLQTAICNREELTISTESRRYTDWRAGGMHPKWLEMEDLPAIAASGAYFGRKFRPESEVPAFLDRTVLQVSPQRSILHKSG